MDFTTRLDLILEATLDTDLFAAVAVVQCGDRFLLGLARKTGDDREGKWICPGGGIKKGEATKKAAERECWEETGIRCKAVGEPFTYPAKPGVAFVHCKARAGQDFDNNHEFSALGWFTRQEMKSLKLYHNVLKLVDRVKR